jgi:hypothetical protein
MIDTLFYYKALLLSIVVNCWYQGMRNSYGMMVNYNYDLDKTETNQTHHAATGHVPMGTDILSWLSDETRSKL